MTIIVSLTAREILRRNRYHLWQRIGNKPLTKRSPGITILTKTSQERIKNDQNNDVTCKPNYKNTVTSENGLDGIPVTLEKSACHKRRPSYLNGHVG